MLYTWRNLSRRASKTQPPMTQPWAGKKKNHSLFLLSVLANHYSDSFIECKQPKVNMWQSI